MRPNERLGVIDLGSNSFRMVVYEAGTSWWKRVDEIYEPVRIGQGMAASARLQEEPVRRALATLEVFAHFASASDLAPGAIDAVATSAIRDAHNAADFLARARQRSQLAIRVLSREQEARYAYLAAVNSTTLHDGFVLDLGGGSLQLVRVQERLSASSDSWPLGTVRVSERFLPGRGPAKRRQLAAVREHVREALMHTRWLQQRRSQRGGEPRQRAPASGPPRLIGMGGTVRNLAAAAQRAAGLPSYGVQGMVIERAALDELVARLAALPAAQRADLGGIKPARADLILAGAVVLQAVMEQGGFEGIETTEAGLREGVFFERLLQGREPPLFEDVRRASVLNLAAWSHSNPTHIRHVAALALEMFDALAELGLHPGDPVERELLWAASMLHDIGMSVNYDDHHKHSRYLILSAGLPGFTPVEVAIIAQAARYHRKGMPDAGPLRALLGDEDRRRLDRLAVLLRLAEDLERSRDQQVRHASMSIDDGAVQLRLVSDGDSVVPRWAAGREHELFARAFDVPLTLAA